MPRTKDVFLFAVASVFLMIAIGATIVSQNSGRVTGERPLDFVETETVTSVAINQDRLNRNERLNSIKQKIAAGAELYIQEEFYEADDLETQDDSSTDDSTLLCSDYKPYSGSWDQRNTRLEVREGARVLYKKTSVSTNSGSTTEQADVLVVALPLAPGAAGGETCLSSDVVGLTTTGGLILNTNALQYSSVNEATLLGYALDGYPIYGPTTKLLDRCGGLSEAGQYRYHISVERGVVLSCYTATPAKL